MVNEKHIKEDYNYHIELTNRFERFPFECLIIVKFVEDTCVGAEYPNQIVSFEVLSIREQLFPLFPKNISKKI